MKYMRYIHWPNRCTERQSLGGELSATLISASLPVGVDG